MTNITPTSAAEVFEKFKDLGGRGPIPNIESAEKIARYISGVDEPIELMASFFGTRAWRRSNIQFKSGPSGNLKKALLDVYRLAIEDAQRNLPLALIPPLDPNETARPYARRGIAMLDVARAAIEACRTINNSEPFGSIKPQGAEWHDFARELAALISNAYRDAGRSRVSFGKPEAPAVRMLVWSLKKMRHNVSAEAVVAAFRRLKAKV